MEVEVFGTIIRDRPFTPYFLRVNGKTKTAIITRVYTEAPSMDEEPGWSDWTDERPFYKFKYTLPRGPRVVFIVPKLAEISLNEFAKAMRSTKYFHAVKKWAETEWMKYYNFKFGVIEYILGDVRIPTDFMYKLTKHLYPEEAAVLFSLNFKAEIKEAVKDLIKLRNVKIVKEWDDEKKKYKLYVTKELTMRFEHAHVLPFTIHLTLRVPLWEVLRRTFMPLRDVLRLVVEIIENPRPINFSKIPEYETVDAVKVIENVLTYAEGRLRSDHMEKIELFFKYHKHFHTPLD